MALSDAQVRSLLCRVRNPIHKCCLIVMYACGLRIGEAVTLEVSSVDKANQLLRVIGKGNKERCVPLPQPVLDELRRLWLTHRNPRWLFPARFHSKHVGIDTLHTTFREVAEAAGIKGITAHCLRHSYATRLLENRFESADSARPREHRHHDHLYASDGADPCLAPCPSRQGDERPLIAAVRRDRGCGRLPRFRGGLPIDAWCSDAGLASPRHHRHHELPHGGLGRPPVALRPMQPRGLLLSLVQEPLLSQVPHQADRTVARSP